MKIQELAIIFVIIILPISIVLSAYTQFQIQTLNTQTLYDTKLTSATFDAIKAFQLNTENNTLSDLSNSKLRDIEASVTTFKNSIMSTFGLRGISEEELEQYIPALVYTMYDGFYIYSPYENTNYTYEFKRKANGEIEYESDGKTPVKDTSKPIDNNGKTMYGLKPYITYSCRYNNKSNIDVVITYSLDNYITVQGIINGNYVNDEGYVIDGITKQGDRIWYNGIEIIAETNLKENIPVTSKENRTSYPYIKINGTKYYYYDGGTSSTNDDEIFYISNGKIMTQGEYRGSKALDYYNNVIKNNTAAKEYYSKAYDFTQKLKSWGFEQLKYEDVYEVDTNTQIYPKDTRKIFVFKNNDSDKNIENELSNFNQHRLAIIRHKIETNLSIAIANYNVYSKAEGIEFSMPELKEDEWELIMDNVAMISFIQGLDIGGKIYNGYTIVNNSETKEVVQEENIFILGKDNYYHRIGDKYLETESNVQTGIPAGRLNLDFKVQSRIINSSQNSSTIYYYPLRDYNASYNSIVTQNDVTTYEDIYAYVNSQNDSIKKAFYMALGRERQGAYKALNTNL